MNKINKQKKREYDKKYREKNKEKLRQQHKEYYKNNIDKIRERVREHRKKPEVRERINKKNRDYWKEHKEEKREYDKKYDLKNKEKRKRIGKDYYHKNKKNILKKNREHQKKNIEEFREYQKDYVKNKRKTNKNFNITGRLRNLLIYALKTYSKTGKIKKSKEYSINYKSIIEHLKPFPEDISKYHVDHIKPLCSFNLEDPKEIEKAFAPENHQWLLAEENMIKGGRYKIIKIQNN